MGFMRYAADMGLGGLICMPSLTTIGTDVATCIGNLGGCDVGLNIVRDLSSASLRWAQLP